MLGLRSPDDLDVQTRFILTCISSCFPVRIPYATYVLVCTCSVAQVTFCYSMDPSGNFPDRDTEVGCHFLLQGIFLTQGSNLYLLHRQADSLPLSHLRGCP